MVNYQDPNVVQKDISAVSKIWHAVAGLYFWEFVTTLDYEWGVIRRHPPFGWTIWIYSTARIFTLMAVILTLVGINVAGHYNCEVETVFLFFFGYLAIVFSSLLIVLRILAIWNKKKVIVVIVAGAWGINLIFQIQAIARIRAVYEPVMSTCVAVNLDISELNVLVTLATDIIFSLCYLVCFVWASMSAAHSDWDASCGNRWGVIWLLVATIAEVLLAVLLCLNLNDPFNLMFLPSSMVTLTIAATRIYRSLADQAFFGCTPGLNLSGLDSSGQSGRVEWTANRVPDTPSHIEVAINSTSDQDQTPQTSQNGLHTSIEEQICEKPGRQRGFDESAENDVESQTQDTAQRH